MKLAPVERSGSWRPSGSDARVAAVSRLQTVMPETAGQSAAPVLSSGRELPVLAVQRGSLAQARPVLQSDKPQDIDATTRAAVGAASIATVDLFASSATSAGVGSPDSSTVATGTAAASGATYGAKRDGKGLSGAPSDDTQTPSTSSASPATAAKLSPKVTVASIAAEQAANAARHLAAEQAKNEPPKEPISKMLLDLVHSVWAASGSVVDAASTSSKARSAAVSKPGGAVTATYTANAVSRSPQSSAS